jgi:putative hemolysin
LLVTEPDSEEVAAAIALDDIWRVPDGPMDLLAEPVIYVPWSTRAADVLELIRRRKREVAAVVNEYGETIGILTFDDILDVLFSGAPSRSERLLRRDPIRQIAPGIWHVTGMTGVRRLARYFRIELPATHYVTLAGVVQEVLERLPEKGDECPWGPLHFKVLDVPLRGQLLIELTMPQFQEPAE